MAVTWPRLCLGGCGESQQQQRRHLILYIYEKEEVETVPFPTGRVYKENPVAERVQCEREGKPVVRETSQTAVCLCPMACQPT